MGHGIKPSLRELIDLRKVSRRTAVHLKSEVRLIVSTVLRSAMQLNVAQPVHSDELAETTGVRLTAQLLAAAAFCKMHQYAST